MRLRSGIAVLGVSLALTLVAQSPAPAAATLGCDTASFTQVQDRSDMVADVLRLTNQHRASLGLPALALDGALQQAAVWKSRDMAARGYFDHTDPASGSAPSRDAFSRFRDCGHSGGGAVAENIAAGRATAASVVADWLASPGHRANIENGALRYIGIGVAYRAGSPYGYYWTQTFSSVPGPAVLRAVPAVTPVKAAVPKSCHLPKLTKAYTLKNVKSKLKKRGCTLKHVTRVYTKKYAKGRVVSWSRHGSKVTVKVAKR